MVSLHLRDLLYLYLPGQFLLNDVHILANSFHIAHLGQILHLLHDLLQKLEVIAARKHHEHTPHLLGIVDSVHQHASVQLAHLPHPLSEVCLEGDQVGQITRTDEYLIGFSALKAELERLLEESRVVWALEEMPVELLHLLDLGRVLVTELPVEATILRHQLDCLPL